MSENAGIQADSFWCGKTQTTGQDWSRTLPAARKIFVAGLYFPHFVRRKNALEREAALQAISTVRKNPDSPAKLSRALVLRSSPIDSLWRHIAPLTPVFDDATVEKHIDDVPVIFIQHTNDLGDREFVVDEQIADGYLSLGFRVQACGIRWKRELLSTNREPIVDNGVFHQSGSPLQGICSSIGAAIRSDYRKRPFSGRSTKSLSSRSKVNRQDPGPRLERKSVYVVCNLLI
jgi:hypothetical protein